MTASSPAARHSRASITDRAMREFEALDQAVARLQPADWDRLVPRPETRDAWTVKDALVHIVYWKSHTARVFRGQKRPAELRGLDVSSLNHLIWREWRDRSPEDVLAWHREVQADILSTLAATPEEWFSRRQHASGWPADFDGHSAGHRLRDIERALA
jgi:hypothetical protein